MENINENNIESVFANAEEKARTMTPDNSAPLMTHDIEEEGCNGLATCPLHVSVDE